MINIPVDDENDSKPSEYSQSDESESESDIEMNPNDQIKQLGVKYKKGSIKTMLIDLYGSREKFLSEYENYLAEKILYCQEFVIESEK